MMHHFTAGASALSLSILLLMPFQVRAGDWPEFLGPNGAARSAESVPTDWSADANLKWKVALPGDGSSSPIIVGDKVIVTCYVAEPESKRQVLCFNKDSGKELWKTDFPIDYREDPLRGYITEHGYASNTPVSDGKSIFVFFGKGGVHCLDMEGNKLWAVDVGQQSSNRQWGSAASLVLYGDTVIVNASEESRTIFALDKATGKEAWKQQAGMLELAYGTPRLATLDDGEQELVIAVPTEVWAMDPENGDLNWYATTKMTGNVCPSVVVDGQTIYTFGGYRSSGSMAVQAGGRDDVSASNTLWTGRSSSYVATPVLDQGKLFWIDDKGIAYCISAETGEQVYRERIRELEGGRPVYASPILIDGKIYAVSRRQGTFVYLPGDEFKLVSQNKFAGDDTDFNASPAVSDGCLFLRSNQALYCVGQ